ncbi:ABC transporter substrate-binding protein [Fluviispira multicolorata]|uniref:ABC transporter substrate-binding protein n=1 Tax=Fluviispira multicolorata TaxID=2654512 RepID=A0A833N538_9BACT|nr:ABC transporter substrate-binding protein [Fluviispira multicolorata]KAB8033442.1 ABC transporter substrate-binding protein [Fluviispira multicolorata]
MLKKIVFILIGLIALLIAATAIFINNKDKSIIKDRKSVTLLLDWKPNTNHAGFYVAKIKGFYEKIGIELKILNPSQTTTTTLVGTGNADFGISYANDIIYARNMGVPIVSIAAIIQASTSCFVWRKSANISDIKGFEGRRYGGWGGPEENATLKYIMENNGADFSKVQMLTTGSQDFLQATLKNVDFTWEYLGWNILAAQLKNIEIETYCPADQFPVFDKPSPLIITSEKMLKENPELVKAFLKATSEGFNFTIENPSEAADNILQSVPELDKLLVKKSTEFLANLYKGNASQWGIQDEKKFNLYATWMKDVGLIKDVPKVDTYINNKFLP